MRGVSSERGRCRISCAVSKPSMIGIRTSSRTTANSLRSRCRKASAPDEASTTFSSRGARMVRNAKRLVASSSTTRMLTFVFSGIEVGSLSRVSWRALVTIRTVEKRLAFAEGQKSATDQAVVHEALGTLLERGLEINEYVRADDEMEIVERSIANQAVAGPCDAALEVSIEACGPAGNRVVVGQARLAAGRCICLLIPPHPV